VRCIDDETRCKRDAGPLRPGAVRREVPESGSRRPEPVVNCAGTQSFYAAIVGAGSSVAPLDEIAPSLMAAIDRKMRTSGGVPAYTLIDKDNRGNRAGKQCRQKSKPAPRHAAMAIASLLAPVQ